MYEFKATSYHLAAQLSFEVTVHLTSKFQVQKSVCKAVHWLTVGCQ